MLAAIYFLLPSPLEGKALSYNGTVRVAILMPLQLSDGSLSEMGSIGLLAAIHAIDCVNNKTDGIYDDILPNISIAYEFYDTHGDGDYAAEQATAVTTAFNNQGAHVLLGTVFPAVADVVAPILESFGVPLVSPFSNTSGLTSTKFENFVRVAPASDMVANGIVQFAAYTVGWKTACVVADRKFVNMAEKLQGAAAEEGVENSKD